MRKKLSKCGNSTVVIIEKPVIDLLGWDKDGEYDLTTDGNRLILEPAKPEAVDLFEAVEK